MTTALWAETDADGEPLDSNYGFNDFAPETLAAMKTDCEKFLTDAIGLVRPFQISQAGHDFWLTRNRHGAGFWDGSHGWGECAPMLTRLAHGFPEVNLYVGDDGLLYL